MKHRSGWNKDKTPREEIFLDTGEKPEEPKGSPITLRHWYAKTPQELLFDGSISMGAKALYGIYHCYATDKYHPRITVTREMVKEHLGVSTKHISTLKNELDDKGWIEVKHRGQGKSDAITLNEYPFQKDDPPRKCVSRREVEVPSRREVEVPLLKTKRKDRGKRNER